MSDSQKWAIPREGLIVRFPTNMIALPSSGAWVDWVGIDGKYWRKKAIQKDITIYDSQPQPPVSKGVSKVTKESKIGRDDT